MRIIPDFFRKSPAIAVAALLGVFLFTATPASAQQGTVNDPHNIWYRAFLLVQAAEKLEEEGKYLDALNKINQASPLYLQLEQSFPEFQPDIIKGRRVVLEEKRDELKIKMRQPRQPAQRIVAKPIQAPPTSLPSGGAREREISIDDTGSEFALPAWEEPQGQSQTLPRVKPFHSRVGEISNSLYEDLERKDNLISQLMKENLDLREKVADRDKTIKLLKQQVATQSNNVSSLRQQAATADGAEKERLKQMLRDSIAQLEQSDNLNKALLAEVEEARREQTKLEEKVKQLERERDNLVELVSGKGNGGKALKELMDRNNQLSQQLDRAEKLAASLSQLNKQKDSDIVLLKSEISKVKSERDQLVQQNAVHQQNIDSLQRKLEMLSDGLSAEERNALASTSPLERQENQLLRNLVLKQLRQQAKIKEAKDLLLQQLDKVGARSDVLLGLVEDMAKGPQLTEQERALAFRIPGVEMTQTNGQQTVIPRPVPKAGASQATDTATLIAPGNAPVENNRELAIRLEQIDQSAREAFSQGDFQRAESEFRKYLHHRPQNVNCLCNLGLLKTATRSFAEAESFLEQALAIDNRSGLANYLLGRALFLQGKNDDALVRLEAGLIHDPKNAEAHNCIGVISSQKGWIRRAKEAFTEAVQINPQFGDAHFNLAILYTTQKAADPAKANAHYRKAMDLGIPKDPQIEAFLEKARAAGMTLGMR